MKTHNLTTVARILNLKSKKSRLPSIIYMTDEVRAPNPVPAIKKLHPGSAVIFRHYDFKSRFNLAIEVKRTCLKHNLLFIVARDFLLAQSLKADGLHLPEYLLLNPTLKSILWRNTPKKLITASVHCKKSLRKCLTLQIDAALISPVFPTESHLNEPTLGTTRFQNLANSSSVPIYALGGVNNENAIQLINSPAIGLAGISAVSNTK